MTVDTDSRSLGRSPAVVSPKSLQNVHLGLQSVAVNAQVQRPLTELAEMMGLSIGTVQKAIQVLEDQGKVRRVKTAPNMPDILELVGADARDQMAVEATKVIAELRAANQKAENLIQTLTGHLAAQSEQLSRWEDLQKRVESRTETDTHEIWLIKKAH